MEKYYQSAKTYILDHKKEFIRGGAIALGIAIIILGLALYSYNNPGQPKLVYEPANACDLLTLDEAKTFLGESTINGVNKTPVQTGVITTSQCGYSDGKVDVENAMVIALNVRTGINDAGIELNKAQFESGIPTENVEILSNIGDQAYFNTKLGQLNVLKQSTWVLISYGPGADPQANKLEDAVKLADKIFSANE